MTPEQRNLLIEILPAYTQSFNWMLKDIKARADELNPDDYSPELQLAISCKETVDALTNA